MDLRLIFFCTTIGALVGTTVGVLLMNRKIRLPITGADLAALRGKLETAETSLAAATANVEELKQQLAERDHAIQQNAEELKKARADGESDRAQRAAAEQRAQEQGSELAGVKEQRAELERKLEEEKKLAAEQHEAQKRQILALTEQVSGLLAESAALSRFREQESLHRASLEAQLTVAAQRVEQLTQQVAELERERSQFDSKLQEERQSAARGMELLVMAQENFSRVLKQVPANGDSHVVRAVETSSAEHGEDLQSAMAAD